MSGNSSKHSSETDWERIDALTDDEIDTSDIPLLTEEFFKRAKIRWPREPVAVTVHLDPEVLAWFRALGEDFEPRLNQALREYVDARKK
jgi:uncharacterized protein (DUF4415 family)